MKKARISRNFNLVWQHSEHPNYQFDKEGNCVNVQTGRKLNLTLIGYTEGYCIKGKFKSLKQLRPKLVKIKDVGCPF